MVRAATAALRQGLAMALALALLPGPGYAAYSVQATAAPGSVASGVNYQGRLEESGFPVTGGRNVTFKVYDALTGGNLLWNSGAQAVVVNQGLFNASIPIPIAALTGGGARYLEVTIEADTLTPREALGSVPYALVAKSVEGVLDVSNGGLNISSSASGGWALFISSATGNVGMGSTAPGTTRLWVQSSPSESFHLRVSSQDATGTVLVVTAAGNVGIGTSSPQSALHIASGGIRFPDGSVQATAGVGSASSLSNNVDAVMNADADALGGGVARVQTRGVDRIYVENGGAVGVGLTNPASILDVEGTARFGAGAAKSVFSAAGALTVAAGADIALSGGSKVTGLAAPTLGGDAANKTYVDGQVVGASGWTDDGAVTRLTGTDRVGVGSTAPGASKLWLQGLDVDDFHLRISSQDATGTLLVVDRLGRVGAGVAAPAYRLDVRGDAGFGSTGSQSVFSAAGALAVASAANITLASGGKVTGLAAPTAASDAATKAYVDAQIPGAGGWTDDGVVTRLASAGDLVGVGTTSPGAKFDVQQAATDNYTLRVSSNNGAAMLVVAASGNVGVGTTAPGSRLEVSGGQAYLHNTPAGGVPLHVRSDTGAGTVAILADTGGNVGVGTSAPQEMLTVGGGTLAVVNASAWDHVLTHHDGAVAFFDAGGAENGLALRVDATAVGYPAASYPEVMRLLPSGNVGVGTTNPSAWFQVGGGTLAALSTGLVGIGTTAPISRLNVLNGDIRISTSAGAANRGIIFADGSIQTTASGSSLWTSNGADIYNGGGGNVGIGITAPLKPLHVYSNVAAPFQPTLESGRTDYPSMLLVKNAVSTLSVGAENNVGGALMTGAAANSVGLAHQGAGKLHFGTSNTARMTIDAAGKVGIGIASPAHLLDVEGKATFGTGVDKSSFTLTGDLIMATNANITLSGIGTVTGLPTPVAASDAVSKSYVDGQVLSASGWTDSGSVVRLTTVGDRLGVGTTSPGAKLAVQGQAADNFHLLVSSQDATGLLALDKAGNMGLGSTSPLSRLHVLGPQRAALTLDRPGTPSSRFKLFVGEGTGQYTVDENYIESVNTGLHFMAGAAGTTEVMTILSSGKVAIGTATPQGSFQIGDPDGVDAIKFGAAASNMRHHLVSNRDLVMDVFDWDGGAANTPVFLVRQDTAKFDESATTARLSVTDQGRVGVNTEAPGFGLDVRGNAAFGAAATQSSFAMTGALTMASAADITLAGGGKVTGLAAPTVAGDAATKLYVDTLLGAGGGWNDDGAVVRLFTVSDRLGVGTTSPGTSKLWLQGQPNDDFHLRVSSQNSSGSLLVVDRLGSVGIGTTSPTRKLHVLSTNGTGMLLENNGSGNSVVEILSAQNAQRSVNFLDSAGASVSQISVSGGTNGISSMTFSTSGSMRVKIDETGDVGIATTDPLARLHVRGGSRATLTLDRAAAADSRFKLFVGDGTGGYATNENFIESLNTGLHIMGGAAGSTELMTILGDGNVGIATTNPTQALTVTGNTNKAGSWILSDLNWGAGNLEVHSNAWDSAGNDNYGGVIGAKLYAYGGLQSGGLASAAGDGELYVAGTSKLAGALGIGTTDPGASKLWLQGAPGSAFHLRVSSQNSTGNLFVVDRFGRIGISTSAPSTRLELIEGDPADSALRVLSGNASMHTAYGIGRTATEAYWAITSAAGEWSDVSATGDTVLRNNTNGIVLSARNATGVIRFATGAGGSETDKMTILNDGKVGIGATNPGRELEVNGGVRLNTATGRPACNAANRGTLWFTQAGAGVKDALDVCAKDATDAYAWRLLY